MPTAGPTMLDVQRIQRDPRLGYAVVGRRRRWRPTGPTAAGRGVADASAGDVEVAGEAADLEQPLDRGAR